MCANKQTNQKQTNCNIEQIKFAYMFPRSLNANATSMSNICDRRAGSIQHQSKAAAAMILMSTEDRLITNTNTYQIQIQIQIFTSQRVLPFPIQMLMDVIDTDRCVSERSSIAFPTRKLWNWSGWPRSEIWGVYQDEVETEQSLLFWRKCGCQSSQVQVQGCNRCFEKYKFNWIWIRGWSRVTDQNFAEMLWCNWCMP